jgi:hypothetical protein
VIDLGVKGFKEKLFRHTLLERERKDRRDVIK